MFEPNNPLPPPRPPPHRVVREHLAVAESGACLIRCSFQVIGQSAHVLHIARMWTDLSRKTLMPICLVCLMMWGLVISKIACAFENVHTYIK